MIGYGPTERPSNAILSLTGSANGVGLCFIHGASLPEPQRILLGSGNQTRFIRVDSAEVLGPRQSKDLGNVRSADRRLCRLRLDP